MAAIREKLHRSSMRLSQMQDLAGCRVIVPEIQAQDEVIDRVSALFAASVLDRRTKPNFGYRAVHLNVSRNGFNIEVQIRTRLQHLWAIYSERLADRFGNELKYGGGPERLRSMLGSASKMVEEFEMFEANFPESHIADPLRDVVRQALEFFLAVAEGRRP